MSEGYIISTRQPKSRFCHFGTLNRYENILFISGTLGLVITLGFAAFWIYSDHNSKSDKFISELIILISSLFSLLYLYRGIFEERPYELMVYVISTTCLIFFVVIDFVQNYSTASVAAYVNIGTTLGIMAPTAMLASCTAYNYNIHGRLIFRTIDGAERLQDDCKNLFVFESLLQLDFQFELSMITLILAVSVDFNIVQILTLTIGVPYSTLWHIAGFILMREELRWGSFVFIFLGIMEPAYVVYIIYNAVTSILNASNEPIINPVTPVVSMTFALCCIAILVRVILATMSVVVSRKFDSGLRHRLNYRLCRRQQADDTKSLVNYQSSLNDHI